VSARSYGVAATAAAALSRPAPVASAPQQISSGGGVSGGIFGAEVGFDLDNTGGESYAGEFSDQDLAQELAGYTAGVAGEEGAG